MKNKTMKNKTISRSARGQSLVEMAISMTAILFLLSGAVDFGIALFGYVAIRDAAQEGALYGSLNPCVPGAEWANPADWDGSCTASDPINLAGIQTRVRGSSSQPVDLADTTLIPDSYITATYTGSAGCEGLTSGAANAIKVTVRYDHVIFMPFVNVIVGGQTIPLSASVTDTILQPPCQ
jgi:hypothetical protein